ncbi:hypothetical protein [Streptomyces sp. PSAA01]|uniref:hypothetical protein n=1 Tax=Streptomyces sp. PSAA01 TaxID=2912762 RepID=UPI001F47A322|nr:hypothetical protein [Streptomyces sp. PSAA01]MCG0285364.1 hypothetical protein [Streptomyces sp. PSAA01]
MPCEGRSIHVRGVFQGYTLLPQQPLQFVEPEVARSRYPHMSIAYTTQGAEDINAVELRQALAAIDGPLAQTLCVDRLHLVEQWHEGVHIRWNPLAEIPLGGQA